MLVTFSVVLLVVLSMPWISHKLYDGLNDYPAIALEREIQRADAIVILSGATYYAAEFGSEVPGPHTMERLRYGALLHRELGLPILVTGGKPTADSAPIANIMAKTLSDDFGITTRWRETAARDTLDNARLSAQILNAAGIQKVYLVTHAGHMRRSVASFENAGLSVIAAPVGVPHPEYRFQTADLVPSARGMQGIEGSAALSVLMLRIFFGLFCIDILIIFTVPVMLVSMVSIGLNSEISIFFIAAV